MLEIKINGNYIELFILIEIDATENKTKSQCH